MKPITLAASLLFLFNVEAQITITSSDFPGGGDTALVSISNDFTLDYAATGADYVWDFASLEMNEQRIDTFFDIDEASFTYQLVFNNGWLDPDYEADYYTKLFNFALPETEVVPFSNPVGFTKIESDRVEIVGIGVEIGGLEVPLKNEIIDVEYELPMTYGDDWFSHSLFEMDLNPFYDGILIRHQDRTSEVDGWGELTTPYGTFDVVRTRAELDFTDSLQLTIGEETTWLELPTPNQIVYTWFTTGEKIPLLKVVAQDILGVETITSVEYRDKYIPEDLSIDPVTGTDELIIYPNPAKNQLFISNETDAVVKIFTLSGALVMDAALLSNQQSIDIGGLESGAYLVSVVTENTTFVQQLIVQ